MNDMMNDSLSDDAVIARLRSALDEVAAGVDTTAADDTATPVIALHPGAAGRRPGRAWLGVAAATAMLVGAGGWALTQRSAPAATGDSTTVVPTTNAGVTGTATLPWFEIRLPDAVAVGEETVTTDPDDNGFTQTWLVRGRNGDPSSLGVLSVNVEYDDNGLPPDPNVFTQIDAPNGTAWLHGDPTGTGATGPTLVWQRDDGTVWWVAQAGLLDPATGGGDTFAEYVFQIRRGTFNDLLNNPDELAEWLGSAPPNRGVTRTQGYAVGGDDANVVLSVGSAPLLGTLVGTKGITEIDVAGNRAWKGTRPDGEVTVEWLIGPDHRGLLRISPLLADRVDEIIDAVNPVGGEPIPVQTTLVPMTGSVAPPESTAPTTTAPTTTTPVANAVRTDYPDLSIVSARIVPTPLQVSPAPPMDALGQVWRVESDSLDGLLLMGVDEVVADEENLAEQGWRTITALEGVTEGRAWLAEGRGDDPAADQSVVAWARPEGVTWGFSWVGPSDSSTDEWIDLVVSATPGSGVPVVIADERAATLSVIAAPTTIVSRSFNDVDGGTATLTVWDSAMLLNQLLAAESVTEIDIDGRTGWRVDDTSLGWVWVYWDAGDGWFAELRFDQNLAGRADEIIAANLVRLDG